MQFLVDSMLQQDAADRPSIEQILQYEPIKEMAELIEKNLYKEHFDKHYREMSEISREASMLKGDQLMQFFDIDEDI